MPAVAGTDFGILSAFIAVFAQPISGRDQVELASWAGKVSRIPGASEPA